MGTPWTPPALIDPTPLEQRVVEAARCGAWAGGTGGPALAELAASEDSDLLVRAELIRELLLGRHGELDPHGVRVRAVRVVGPLDLDNLTATVPLVLRACVIPEPVTCRNARLRELDLSGSALTILAAEGASVDGGLTLQDIEVRGADDNGAVRLSRARIGGHVSLERAQVVNDFGPGVHAVNLRVDGDLVLSGAVVRGCGDFGALRLLGTRVDGTAGLEGIHCANNSGPGLTADRLHVDGGLFLTGAVVRGNGDKGALRLLGARIGGQVDLSESTIVNDLGTGFHADDLHVGDDLFLAGAVVRGSGEKGALRLPGADLRGQLVLENARVDNPSGPLLVLIETQVAEALVLPASLVCPHSKALRAGRPCPGRDRQIIVQCLVFARLAKVSWQKWLHLLVEHTPDYVPQPFQQLAAVERTAGHDANAREILIVQQDQLRRWQPKALGGRWGRWRHQAWGFFGRYGYRSHRLVAALVVALALAGGTAYLAGHVPTRPGHHAAERVQSAAQPVGAAGTRCSTVELVGLGLDRGLPVGATGLRSRCDLDTGTRRGQLFTVLLWLLQAALWALATLTVAAYTGMIRKPA